MNKTRAGLLSFGLLAASLLPTTAQAQSGACGTTRRFPHSILQACDGGSTQEVFFEAGSVTIMSSSGLTTVGQRVGPWLIWTDNDGVQCATGAAVSQIADFYPLSCPPPGVPVVT